MASSPTSVSLSGLASGFDWQSFIDQMVQVERAPEQRMQATQATINQKNAAYDNVKALLTTFQTQVKALNDPTLYDSRTAQTSDSTVATATAAGATTLGSFTFSATQLATAARIDSSANIASPLSPTSNVSGLTLSSAAFPVSISAGTFRS